MPVIYSDNVEIPSFGGFHEGGDGYNMSMRYAREMQNVDVTGGSFAPMRKGTAIKQRVNKPITTLACLSRRYNVHDDERDVLVAFADGKVFTKLLDHDDPWVVRYEGLSTDQVDYVTYEVSNGSEMIDVLLFTNAIDGMFCLYGDSLVVATVNTPYKFGVLERHQERIWGSGVIDYPDMLVYSGTYNPFNWEQNSDIPEDGAGEINQPSWDGDSFLALRSFGSQLLAFKKKGIWRIIGTDPGNFVIKEQYGGGTIVENTACVGVGNVLMLGWDGLMRYDGTSTQPYQQDATSDLLQRRINVAAIDKATAVMVNSKTYMLALPVDGSKTNNVVMTFDTSHQFLTLRDDISVGTFLKVDNRVFYTSATAPGIVYEMDNKGDVLECYWESGMQDRGIKSSIKSAFTIYFTAEAEAPFELNVGIQTEKKRKMKRVIVKPNKAMRVNVNVQGRYFALVLSSDTTVPFKIVGGMKIAMELDPD